METPENQPPPRRVRRVRVCLKVPEYERDVADGLAREYTPGGLLVVAAAFVSDLAQAARRRESWEAVNLAAWLNGRDWSAAEKEGA